MTQRTEPDEAAEWERLGGVVSLGMGPRAEATCPVCGHDEALVTHTVDGAVVHVCAECGHTTNPD